MPSLLPVEGAAISTTLFSNGVVQTPKNRVRGSKNSNMQTQHMRVGHQRINIDVDLDQKKIQGFTEITILPLTNLLRVIKLDCREMKINNIYINNIPHTNYIYEDMLYINDDAFFEGSTAAKSYNMFDLYSKDVGIHQHHLIRQKLNYIFGEVNMDPNDPTKELNSNTEELVILLPDNLNLELTDVNSINQTPITSMTPLNTKSRNTFNEVYTPIQIKIDYETKNPRNGVNFVTPKNVDKKSWVAYTTNSDYGVSTSSWVPCIDNLWDRCTWSLEVNVPRSAKDIGNPRFIGADDDNDENNFNTEKQKLDDKDSKDELDEDEEEQHDLVVCSGDLNNVKETPHPLDFSKKVVSWAIFNPVCAQHVGWAIGCFQSIELLVQGSNSDVEDEEFDESSELGKTTTTSPVTIYCFPDQVELARNSCIFSGKAIDFFLREFGSFPFSSFAMVFVPGCVVDSNNFAGISIMSDNLLYPPDLIESMFSSTSIFVEAIATQWAGINIVPYTFNDTWTTIGISRFMANQFIKTLMGGNEHRFRMKKLVDQIVNEDIGKKPLALQNYRFPISDTDLDFLKLKAPIVLYILDRRMTKTDKSFGLSRVLPKLFLQAMSGELPNGTLSTEHLQYVCEKVNRNKLDNFFKQWVYGAGVPIFNITQKFNKKKMAIEMHIRQVQLQETKLLPPSAKNFVDDSISHLDDEVSYPTQAVFTGPMTIRVHEQDGTPYEHIVDLKDGNTRIDIQYNSKFRRRRKEENPEVLTILSGLGDVLTEPSEIEDWHLETWTRTEEEILTDAFEWIRVDADFEWIAKFRIDQPEYMYASQLQHDRDVEAQFEAVKYFGLCEKPTYLECTILTRTLMDKKYYYGVRVGAADALAKFSNVSNNYLGVEYLIRIFKELYCFPNSAIPRSNDFNDFGDYFVQKLIPKILSTVRDEEGEVPFMIKSLLLNFLKYNDNSNNDFQDCFYLAELLKAITNCAIKEGSTIARDPLQMSNQISQLTEKNRKFVVNLETEIERLLKLDEWMPSHQRIVTISCLQQKVRLASHGLIGFKLEDLMYYTLENYPDIVRVEAFKSLFILGAIKNRNILEYFLKTVLLANSSAFFRSGLVTAIVNSICIAAIDGVPSNLDDPEFKTFEKLEDSSNRVAPGLANLVIIEDSLGGDGESRKDVVARATLHGAIELLRRDYAIGEGLKETFWELLHSSMLSINERKDIFNVCQVLYAEIDQFIVRIPIPSVSIAELKKKIVLRDLGYGKVVFKREGRFKIQFTSRKLHITAPIAHRSRDQRAASKAKESTPDSKLTLNLTPRLPERRRTALKAPKVVEPSVELTRTRSRKPSFVSPAPVIEPVLIPDPVPEPEPKPEPEVIVPTIETAPPNESPSVSQPILDTPSLVTRDNDIPYKVTFKIPKTYLSTIPEFKEEIVTKNVNEHVKINQNSVLFIFKGTFKTKFQNLVTAKMTKVKEEVLEEIIPNGETVNGRLESDVPRYIRIFTKSKTIEVSSTPFEEEHGLNSITKPVVKLKQIKIEPVRRAPSNRMTSLDTVRPVYKESDLERSKSNSPDPTFEELKNKVKKKKVKAKPKVYIHSGESSAISESPEEFREKSPEKKLKLKLSFKK